MPKYQVRLFLNENKGRRPPPPKKYQNNNTKNIYNNQM